MRKKIERGLVYVIPVIAIAILCNQLLRQHLYDLSTWKGGGMGMFAAWDRPPRARFIHIYGIDRMGELLPITETGRGIYYLKYRVTAEPSDKNLAALLRRVSSEPWRYGEAQRPLYTQNEKGDRTLSRLVNNISFSGAQPADLVAVRIEYGEIRYDRSKHALMPVVIKERQHEL
jgi:hypothetical protein